jgi:hypothetical protein
MKIYNKQHFLLKLSFRNKDDMVSNEMCKDIFSIIKNNQKSFTQSYSGIQLNLTVTEKDSPQIEKIPNLKYGNFDINVHMEASFNGEEFQQGTINIEIILSNSFSKKDYQSLNYVLYEAIRHEIEHKNTFETIGTPQEDYQEIFNNLSEKQNLIDHCQTISQYMLHPQELPSYAKSIYYYAKKSKKNYEQVIDEVLNRALFFNDLNIIQQSKTNKEIVNICRKIKKDIIKKIKAMFPNDTIKMTWV